jgi:hypothetical protein
MKPKAHNEGGHMDTINKWERMSVAKGIEKGKAGIDREKKHSRGFGVIYGYAVMRKGFVKDSRGWEIDDNTLETLVKLGNASKIGIKSRFGHPEMSSSALGTFLGRAHNFRNDNDIVRADLYIDSSAYNTPKGNLGQYVLDLAESDPDAFGTSVVMGGVELEYKIEKDGSKKKDAKGKDLPPALRFKALMASDVVDEGAATDGMFEYEDGVQYSAQATLILDRFMKLPNAEEKLYGFLDRYFSKDYKNETDDFKEQNEEEEPMSAIILKEVTLAQLKAENPALFESIYNEGLSVGKDQGVLSERKRCVEILKKGKTYPEDMSAIALECVESGSDEQGSIIKFQEKQLAALEKIRKDNEVGPEGEVTKTELDTKGKSSDQIHLMKAEAYQKEHKCSLTDALKATAEKRK